MKVKDLHFTQNHQIDGQLFFVMLFLSTKRYSYVSCHCQLSHWTNSPR